MMRDGATAFDGRMAFGRCAAHHGVCAFVCVLERRVCGIFDVRWFGAPAATKAPNVWRGERPLPAVTSHSA
eukprot:1133589-Prymnesium_polylepis.1